MMPLTLPIILKSDGCSFFPDGDYFSCCEKHDLDYAYSPSRSHSDLELRKCITRDGHPVLAWIIWLGVRLFGYPFWLLAKYKVRKMSNVTV